MAVEAYTQHIKNYTKRMTKALNENFKRNKPDAYSQTEWLVLWNKGKSKKQILEDADIDGTGIDDSTINKAFRKFKEYGLPVRKQKGKNLRDKNA